MKLRILALCALVACGSESGAMIDAGDDLRVVESGPEDAPQDPPTDSPADAAADAPEDVARDAPVDANVDVPADSAFPDAGRTPGVIDITDDAMDPRRGFTASIAGDGRLIVAGGTGGATTLVETWAFELRTNSWERLADLPAPHVRAAEHVLDDGRVLVAGGSPAQFATSTNQDVFVFDPATDSWSAAGEMTVPRGQPQMHTLTVGPRSGEILMIGGEMRSPARTTFSASLESYNATAETAQGFTATMPTGRASFMSWPLSDGRIAILGGYDRPGDPDGSALDEILVFDPSTDAITVAAATLPEAGLLLLGGELEDGRLLALPTRSSSSAIWAFDRDTFAATRLGEVPPEQTNFGIAYAETVFLFGGRRSGEVDDDILRFNRADGSWTRREDLLSMPLAFIQPVPLPDGRFVLLGGQTTLDFLVGNTAVFTPE
ncbi:MAG: kelch repeat-containing protein [Myxococcota bacterium]